MVSMKDWIEFERKEMPRKGKVKLDTVLRTLIEHESGARTRSPAPLEVTPLVSLYYVAEK
jgi:hypothetical protein